MKRDTVQTVTMPILVEANSMAEADDKGTFFPANWAGSAYVHVVTEKDAKTWLRTQLSSKDQDMFFGLSYLKNGIDEADEYTLMRGYEKLRPLDKHLASPESPRIELGPKNGLRITIGGGEDWKWYVTDFNYSALLTDAIKNTRFVMWYSHEKYGRMLPALYCRDKKTAVFAMRIAGDLRVCPQCDALFVPAARNVNYCCVEHREAYRIARFRWNKKRAVSVSSTAKKRTSR